ncbi:hypothetical protein FLP10_11245 [Agromyces intestinalis]|uniref:Uncharacterized protein n=1 Tax=Agromyces intestinalis TaxID=2592652 RepID=A0A5C1YFG0_9MICO|nr:hypothetical protein [Agromyces intestinalis]QEO14926.1 hypothetical protein FLP10_11245 [Agromyces intestinalis]
MEARSRRMDIETARLRFAPDSTEHAMLGSLSASLGSALVPVTITIEGGTRFEVEAADPGGRFFAQFVANQGEFKSVHRNRVSANLFKLAWLGRLLPDARLALCVSGTATQAFTPSNWVTLACADLGIDVVVFHDDASLSGLFGSTMPDWAVAGHPAGSSQE